TRVTRPAGSGAGAGCESGAQPGSGVSASGEAGEPEEVRLTPTEWQLLEILVRADGKLVTGPHLLHEVWGPQYGTELNYLRQYLAQLRRKLEPEPSKPRYLITEAGMGYRFER
ncbi:MAG: helix-turn-helix domain-containing protein, partial [Solirubrobacteraceae bacterium]|nr:helix-turn-helix domain-containing protein [Solirubrobacteraceae bacterium]